MVQNPPDTNRKRERIRAAGAATAALELTH
jgi:hypothetical protein